MNERRRQLLGASADDADVRGEHSYPDDPAAAGSDPPRRNAVAAEAEAEDALLREPGQYAAGAEGTQRITTPVRRP